MVRAFVMAVLTTPSLACMVGNLKNAGLLQQYPNPRLPTRPYDPHILEEIIEEMLSRNSHVL